VDGTHIFSKASCVCVGLEVSCVFGASGDVCGLARNRDGVIEGIGVELMA
jgi:hypothetical protein